MQQQILLNYLVQTEQQHKMLQHLLQDLLTHGVVVLSNVKGTFAINEVTGQTSNNSATIQASRLGLRRS